MLSFARISRHPVHGPPAVRHWSAGGKRALPLSRKPAPCACGGECPRCRGENLAIGKPSDPLEQEAERIAEQVIHTPLALAASGAGDGAERRNNSAPRR